MHLLFLLGRVLYGGFFLLSGSRHFTQLNAMVPYAASKGIPAPKIAVPGSGLLAALGGLSILLGVWPRLGVLLIAVFLLPVTFSMHNYWSDRDPQARQMNQVQFHKNIALLGAALMFLMIPHPWVFSLAE
jgi:putative oxidoreductase